MLGVPEEVVVLDYAKSEIELKVRQHPCFWNNPIRINKGTCNSDFLEGGLQWRI